MQAVSARDNTTEPVTVSHPGVDLQDVIVLPSRTRPDGHHFVRVNVLAGCTSGCSCAAGQRGEMCWARKEVDAVEGSWGFERCAECGVLCRLGHFYAGSGSVAIWVCPRSDEHSSHEDATAVLFRNRQSCAVGSRGSWSLG